MRRARIWLLLVAILVAIGGGAVVIALPSIVRWGALSGIRAATGRPASIDAVDLALRAGHLTINGLRVQDRDGGPALVQLDRLDVRFRWLPLLRGRLYV